MDGDAAAGGIGSGEVSVEEGGSGRWLDEDALDDVATAAVGGASTTSAAARSASTLESLLEWGA